jgi:prevent-host-death family protein
MPTYTVHEAKTQLSKLIERAEAGEEVIIARRDTPAVKLVAIDTGEPKRTFGAYKGQATITDEFFDPLPPDELAAWEAATPNIPARKSRRARK